MIWKPTKEKRIETNVVLIPFYGYPNKRIIAKNFREANIQIMRETCLGSYDLGCAKKRHSEYDCNCHDKNGQKYYDDQH